MSKRQRQSFVAVFLPQAVLVLGLGWSGQARGQGAATGDLVPPVQLAALKEHPAPGDPRLAETRERIRRGEELYQLGDFDGALVEFRRAHELLAGHPMQPLAVYNIGRCLERLFRYGEALVQYRLYLQVAGPGAEDRAEVLAKIELLEGLLATVRLDVSVASYQVWVDNRQVGQDLGEVLVPGGNHVIEIRAHGYGASRQQVAAPARTEHRLSFVLEPRARGLHQAYFWTASAVALVSVGVAAAFGGLALAEHDRVADQAADPTDGWLVTQGDLDGISRLALTADILYGAAGLLAVAATVLAFITDWRFGLRSEGEHVQAHGQPSLLISPSVGPGFAGLHIGGDL